MIYHWSWVCLFMNEWPKFLASQLPEWNGQVVGDTIIYSKESVSWSQLHVRILLRDFKKISNSIKHFFIMLFSEFIILIDFKEKKNMWLSFERAVKDLSRWWLSFRFLPCFFSFQISACLIIYRNYMKNIWNDIWNCHLYFQWHMGK